MAKTYAQSAGTTKFLLQTINVSLRCAGLVRTEVVGKGAATAKNGPEGAEKDPAPAGGEVGVLLWREDGKNVVVLVEGFAVVAALLLVPPIAVRIAELALDGRRVDVAAIL